MARYILLRLLHSVKTRPWLWTAAILAFYLAFTAAVTWPFALHPFNTTIAPLGGDIDGSISKYEALRQGHQDPFFTTHFSWIAWPLGPPNNVGVDRVSLFSTLILWLGSHMFGTILTHSLVSFSGIFLTAGVTFWLLRRITGSDLAGLIAGVTFAFSPQMYGTAISDMTYAHMWLYLLPIWGFWELITQGYSRRGMALAALSIVPAVFWTPYYMFHALIIGATCLAIAGYYLQMREGTKKALLVCAGTGAFWLLMLLLYRYVGLHSPLVLVPQRPLSDLYQQSAEPLMYLLPGNGSWGLHGNWLLAQLVPRAAKVNLYVGLSTLALAGTGLVWLYRRSRPVGRGAAQVSGMRTAAVLAGWVALVCVTFSLPPSYHFGTLKILMPGDLVGHVAPALRAGQRFVMPVKAALAVLAGIGAALVLARVPKRWRPWTALAITLVVMADLWALPSHGDTTIQNYSSLGQLAGMSRGPVAWLENGSMLLPIPHTPCLLEHEFRQPLINDCALGRSPNFNSILQLPLCDEISSLQAIGTRYAVLAPGDRQTEGCLNERIRGEQVVAKDDTYEVVELPLLSEAQARPMKKQYGLR